MKFGMLTLVRVQRWVTSLFLYTVGMVDHRRYMRLFIRAMKQRGMDIEGTPRYISPRAVIDGTDLSLIHLGDGSVISSGVRLLTHDFSIDRVAREDDLGEEEVVLTGSIWVGKRCFVGAGSILMPGSHLGDGAIVGAGSVVRGRVPDNAIVMGNPAMVVSDTDKFLEKNRSRARRI